MVAYSFSLVNIFCSFPVYLQFDDVRAEQMKQMATQSRLSLGTRAFAASAAPQTESVSKTSSETEKPVEEFKRPADPPKVTAKSRVVKRVTIKEDRIHPEGGPRPSRILKDRSRDGHRHESRSIRDVSICESFSKYINNLYSSVHYRKEEDAVQDQLNLNTNVRVPIQREPLALNY